MRHDKTAHIRRLEDDLEKAATAAGTYTSVECASISDKLDQAEAEAEHEAFLSHWDSVEGRAYRAKKRGVKMSTKQFILTGAGAEKVAAWVYDTLKPGVKADVVYSEAMHIFEDRHCAGETVGYELRARYTKSGRAETISLIETLDYCEV